jgi:CrcB protein
MLKLLIFAGAGGFAGSVLRYSVTMLFQKLGRTGFPFATLTVNVIGSYIAGIIMAYFLKTGNINEEMRVLLMVGICGGLTTFSSFSYENVQLIQESRYSEFLLYSLGSIVLGIIAVLAGIYTVNHFAAE